MGETTARPIGPAAVGVLQGSLTLRLPLRSRLFAIAQTFQPPLAACGDIEDRRQTDRGQIFSAKSSIPPSKIVCSLFCHWQINSTAAGRDREIRQTPTSRSVSGRPHRDSSGLMKGGKSKSQNPLYPLSTEWVCFILFSHPLIHGYG